MMLIGLLLCYFNHIFSIFPCLLIYLLLFKTNSLMKRVWTEKLVSGANWNCQIPVSIQSHICSHFKFLYSQPINLTVSLSKWLLNEYSA